MSFFSKVTSFLSARWEEPTTQAALKAFCTTFGGSLAAGASIRDAGLVGLGALIVALWTGLTPEKS